MKADKKIPRTSLITTWYHEIFLKIKLQNHYLGKQFHLCPSIFIKTLFHFLFSLRLQWFGFASTLNSAI